MATAVAARQFMDAAGKQRAYIHIRCSRLPMMVACAQSAFPGDVLLDTSNEMTAEGNAIHAGMKNAIDGGRDWIDVRSLARQFGVEDVLSLVQGANWLWRWWQGMRVHFPAPLTEQPMQWVDDEHGIILTGTADLLSVCPGNPHRLHGADWKSGWGDEDAEAQVKGYAWLAMQESDFEDAKFLVPRPRLGVVDGYPEEAEAWTRAELGEWWDALAQKIVNYPGYSPGYRQCRYCPRQLDCAALVQLNTFARNYLAEAVVDGVIAKLTAAELIDLHGITGLAAKTAETVRDLVKTEVAARGGRVAASGRALRIREETQRPVDMRLGLPVLENELPGGAADLAEALDLGKTKARKILGNKEWGKLEKRLDEAGALGTKVIEKLVQEKDHVDAGKAIAGERGDANSNARPEGAA